MATLKKCETTRKPVPGHWFSAGTLSRTLLCSFAALAVSSTAPPASAQTRISSAALSLVQLQTSSPWPKFHANSASTGVGIGQGCTGVQKWARNYGGGFTASPAVAADGTIYTANGSSNIYAINPDGSQKWDTNFSSTTTVTCPAIGADGTVYVAVSGAGLYALNPTNGHSVWLYPNGAGLFSSPAIGTDGNVYFGSSDGYLYAVDTSGNLAWKFKTLGQVNSSPAVGSDGTVYVGSLDGNVYAINHLTGQEVWAYTTGASIESSPAVTSDTVFIGSDDSNVYAIDSAAGTLDWKFLSGGQVTASPALSPTGDAVFVGSFDGNFYAIDASTGKKNWSVSLGSNIHESAAIGADGTVYISPDTGNLLALDPSSGASLWTFSTGGGGVSTSPAIAADGTVYFGSYSGSFFAVGTAPVITSLDPTSANMGAAGFPLTVNGRGFAANSQVRWSLNGITVLSTTQNNSQQLTATVPTSLLATSGNAKVYVYNPTSGYVSNLITFPVNAPSPSISSVSPISAAEGGSAFTLTVTGSNFIPTSTARWSIYNTITVLSTTYNSGGQLTAQVPASLLTGAGNATLYVYNPGPGGGVSNYVQFPVQTTPYVNSMSQTSAGVGGSAFTLTLNGSGFNMESQIRWSMNGIINVLTTTHTSAAQLSAQLPAGLLVNAGTAQVYVYNPGPGGGVSNLIPFYVQTTPAISSLSPTFALTGTSGATVTVNGSGFNPGSQIRWSFNHVISILTTQFVSSSKLTATVPSNLLAAPGSASVYVYNPGGGGGVSNLESFAIINPPSISSINPPSTLQGGPSFTLDVKGADFSGTCEVRWSANGKITVLATTYMSSGELTATVPASLIASSGSATVYIYSPDTGGVSNFKSFTIN